MRLAERLEMLERNLDELRLLSTSMPVVVEGRRDVDALRGLGVAGEIVMLKAGAGAVLDVCDALAERCTEIVALPDWDRTGGHLMRLLRDNLRGRVDLHREIRKIFAVYAEVATVEALPTYMENLRSRVTDLEGRPGS